MPEEMTRRQLAPADIYEHLVDRKDLEVIRDELGIACTVGTLRRLIIDTARGAQFMDAILSDTPIKLVDAVRQLLDSWFVEGASEREQLRRLRRAVVTVDQLRACLARGLGERSH